MRKDIAEFLDAQIKAHKRLILEEYDDNVADFIVDEYFLNDETVFFSEEDLKEHDGFDRKLFDEVLSLIYTYYDIPLSTYLKLKKLGDFEL